MATDRAIQMKHEYETKETPSRRRLWTRGRVEDG